MIVLMTTVPQIRLTAEELAEFLGSGDHVSLTVASIVLDVAASLIHRTNAPHVEVVEAGRGAVSLLHSDGTESHASRLPSRALMWERVIHRDWRPAWARGAA